MPLTCIQNSKIIFVFISGTRLNARELENDYMEERLRKKEFRSPLPPDQRPPPGLPLPPYNPRLGRVRGTGPTKSELRRARAKKPKSPLAIDAPKEEESPPSSSTSSLTDEGASASPSTTKQRKKNLAQNAASRAMAKFSRRRELLESGSTDLAGTIEKLSLLSFDELDDDIEDLHRDSDHDLTDDEASDDDYDKSPSLLEMSCLFEH